MPTSYVAWHIYTLADPRTGQVRYVGWSTNPRRRFSTHVALARRSGTYKYHWIAQLLAEGLRPVVAIVESGRGDGWSAAERQWIGRMRAEGHPLTNLTVGGEGSLGFHPSEETRHKMSVAQRGRKQTPESTAKTRAALLGRKQSAGHRAKLAAIRKGRMPIAATMAAAIANHGRRQSADHIEKRIAPHRGRPHKLRKLQPEAVRAIRMAQGSISQRALSARYGVAVGTVHAIQHRTRYSDVPDCRD